MTARITIELEESGWNTVVEIGERTYQSRWKEAGGGFKEVGVSTLGKLAYDNPKLFETVEELDPHGLYKSLRMDSGLMKGGMP